MRKDLLGCVAVLLASFPTAWGQGPVLPESAGATTQVVQQDLSQGSGVAPVPGEVETSPEVPEAAEAETSISARPQRLWVRAEYLLWWIKHSNFPVAQLGHVPGLGQLLCLRLAQSLLEDHARTANGDHDYPCD